MVNLAAARIRATFAAVGARGVLHACDVETPMRGISVDAGQRVPLASTYKLLVAVAVLRAVDSGRLEPTQRIRVPVNRTPGPTGIGAMRDAVSMSVRDLLLLALTVSDNAAADVLHDLAGDDNIQGVALDLSLRSVEVRGRVRDFVSSIPRDLGVAGSDVPAALAHPEARSKLSALDPSRTTAGSMRDLTRLLRAIWRDQAASSASCAELRRLLGLQVWPHRIAAGFPEDDVAVSGKTATLPGLRGEAAVIEMPDGRSFAVAAMAHSVLLPLNQPRVDTALGTAARIAVLALHDADAGHDPQDRD